MSKRGAPKDDRVRDGSGKFVEISRTQQDTLGQKLGEGSRGGKYHVVLDETLGRESEYRRRDDGSIKIFLRGMTLAIRSLGLEMRFMEGDPENGLDLTARRVSRCRSLLQAANVVLPPSIREDALDEWMDEIQCAAEEGLPVRRRALSILFRSLPAAALRARLRIRARRREG